ncbi:hypothetical protein LINPERPRIM_LOCUS25476 [Linum perenne]
MATNRPLSGCGQMIVIRTSWTDSNPRRPFLLLRQRLGACRFFWWVDLELDEYVKHIVVGFRWKIRDMERVNRGPNFGDRCKKFGYVLIIVMLGKM